MEAEIEIAETLLILSNTNSDVGNEDKKMNNELGTSSLNSEINNPSDEVILELSRLIPDDKSNLEALMKAEIEIAETLLKLSTTNSDVHNVHIFESLQTSLQLKTQIINWRKILRKKLNQLKL